MKVFALLLLALVAIVSALPEDGQQMARVAHYEPVEDFTVNEAKTSLGFKAYGRQWTFTIWESAVSTEREDTGFHFHGSLVGEEGKASFTITEAWTSGMIILSNDTLWLEATNPSKPDSLFIYRSSDVWFHPDLKFNCAHAGEQHRREEPHVEDGIQHDKRGIVSSRVFADQFWVSPQYNPYFYTREATLALLNDVNVVYGNAGLSQFAFTLTAYGTYTVGNSWTTNSALSNMLNSFTNWATYGVGITPYYNTVAWLVGNNVGGLAWLSSACGRYGNYYKTSVSGLAYWSRLWTVKTIAHELGHNRGAGHDFAAQCAQGQTSGCQCSVMSYCFPAANTAGGAVNYFSGTSAGQIAATCN